MNKCKRVKPQSGIDSGRGAGSTEDLGPPSQVSKGSYNQLPYLSQQDLRPGNIGVTRRLHSSRSSLNNEFPAPQTFGSSTTFSQLKLDSLAQEKNWDDLEDFQLEELRDGFFDAIFTKPERVSKFFHEDALAEDNPDLGQHDHIHKRNKSLAEKVTSVIDCHSKNIYSEFTKEWLSILKFCLAYIIAMVLCAIKPAGWWFGHEYRYFFPLAVIIHHPARNVGVQLEITLFSIIGISFGLGWSSLAWYISTATGPTASHQGGILFQSLFMALLFATWFKVYFQRFLQIGLTFGITIIFTHTVKLVFSKDELDWLIMRDFALSYIFGALLSLLVCVSIFPHSGNSLLIEHFDHTLLSIKGFLFGIIDKDTVTNSDSSIETLINLQNDMVNNLSNELAQGYRDFFNQISFAKFNRQHLENLRNNLTIFVSPLRVLPLPNILLDHNELSLLSTKMTSNNENRNLSSEYSTSKLSNSQTPLSFSGSISSNSCMNSLKYNAAGGLYNGFYIRTLQKTFSKPVFALILEMILCLETISQSIRIYNNNKANDEKVKQTRKQLSEANIKLKKKINHLDISYKKFTKTNLFTHDLLKNNDSVTIFVFLRYIRNSAKNLVNVIDSCDVLGSDIHWRIQTIHYPLSKAIYRLPKQCSMDEGSDSFLHYFETKNDVEEIFEKVYNSYTSKHAYTKVEKTESIRAIDHTDFNLHTTNNPFRYKIWKISSKLFGKEMKWAFKVVFCITFLCLPTWLTESYRWYQEFQCWWAPLLFYILVHRKPTGGFKRLLVRLMASIFAMFWAWAANQARHFSNPYIICVFSGLISVPCAINLFIYKNVKTTFSSLICFTIIVLEIYSKDSDTLNTAMVWKNTWITGLSLLIGIIVSVTINWIFWSYKARTELRLAMSSLLTYLSQSYQSITDRYLYRDRDDQPTELTLAFGHIREVRLTQNIEAIWGLLDRAKVEPNYISNFDAHKYESLINSCQHLLKKLIESRIASSYFEVWDRDQNKEATRALLSLRRDGVASVIFVFYILANCFSSKNKIPKYLPNTLLSRKKLYDYISRFDQQQIFGHRKEINKSENLERMVFRRKEDSPPGNNTEDTSIDAYEKSHWTEVYGIVFARSFTEVCEGVEILVNRCKDILGEEFY